MIICVNDRKTIDEDSFVSDYENFIIESNNGRKFLYKKVLCCTDSNKFVYMRVREDLGKTILDFDIVIKDKTTFKDMINANYNTEYTYDIYKASKIDFPNLDVTYSY